MKLKSPSVATTALCGRRAFFGRFIMQAFGIPTAARKEPGHATLANWHPDGWATRLGGETKPGDEWRPGGRGFYAAMNDARSNLIVFVRNKAGETLLHLSRYSKEGDAFEYTFNAPKAGKYQLAASVVTPKWDQRLFATTNGGTPFEMTLPYTIAMWDTSKAVEIELKAGSNVLQFHGPARATFRNFTLTPQN